jgi:hypothetical protein
VNFNSLEHFAQPGLAGSSPAHMGWPGPSPKYKKTKKTKIRVSINKKNKYEFIVFIH